MRIAIHNHYAEQNVAETEFSKRIIKAASQLGWEARDLVSSVELSEFNPDFAIALTFRTPKLTRYPTYGSMVNPPSYFSSDEQFVKNVLSYDGYLCSSQHISCWLRDILYRTPKSYFIAPWYTSAQTLPYRPPQLTAPRLIYSGTNWDGPRYRELFEELDGKPYFDVYGPPDAWRYLTHSYRGTLPFDGVSILNALHTAGVGLCLHRREHCDSATPSSRIFEIAASGGIAICQEHPFIRDVFQDSVLYLEDTADPQRFAEQISEHMTWIAQHPDEALTLSRRAHDIFAQSYTLEKLLSDLIPRHEQLVQQKKCRPSPSPKTLGDKSVQFIVRVGDRSPGYVDRALHSLGWQNHPHVGAIVVQYKDVPGLSQVLEAHRQRLPIHVVHSSFTGSRSTQLWDGLRAVSSEFFGILDDDDAFHPNHANLLIDLLDRSKDCGVAYAGAIRIWESDLIGRVPADLPSEPAELMYFEPFDRGRIVALDNFITSNAFLARSSLLTDLGSDPQLPFLEDLFLLLLLCRKTNFVFSYEATCEFRWRGTKTDNSMWLGSQHWLASRKRIESLLWKESFPSSQQVGRSSLSQLESRLEARLTEIETTLTQTKAKSDAVTLRLERYLNLPLFNVIRRVRRKLFRLPPPQA